MQGQRYFSFHIVSRLVLTPVHSLIPKPLSYGGNQFVILITHFYLSQSYKCYLKASIFMV
jgi:hypothetical protein